MTVQVKHKVSEGWVNPFKLQLRRELRWAGEDLNLLVPSLIKTAAISPWLFEYLLTAYYWSRQIHVGIHDYTKSSPLT